jgi:hypothetical protein
MTSEERYEFILSLDEKLLKGGLILSEWSTFLIKDADTAFFNKANLATILVSQAAIECHLRYEYLNEPLNIKGFYNLIEHSPIPDDLKKELHILRKYRNKWVHVNEPSEDEDLLKRPDYYENELEQMAIIAIRLLHEVIYLEQCL